MEAALTERDGELDRRRELKKRSCRQTMGAAGSSFSVKYGQP
jgi:hypothetical protein